MVSAPRSFYRRVKVGLTYGALALLPPAVALWYGQWLFSVAWLFAIVFGVALNTFSSRREPVQFSKNAFASGRIALSFGPSSLRAESGDNVVQCEYSQLRLIFEYPESFLIGPLFGGELVIPKLALSTQELQILGNLEREFPRMMRKMLATRRSP